MNNYNIIYQRINLAQWIYDKTKDSKSVVEFGAMFFDKLHYVNSTVVDKIGIEIHEPYIKRAESGDPRILDYTRIHGDMREYDLLVKRQLMDCALFVDTLEHLMTVEAIALVKRVKQDFNKILLMVPQGNHPQTKDVHNMGEDEYQTHRSSWEVEDVINLGFQEIIVDSIFHGNNSEGKDEGCIFAVWNKI